MKTKLLIFGLMLAAYGCKAQIYPQGIIPLENYQPYVNSLSEDEEIQEGTYFKDVNNVLDKYLGTWTGTYDNKNYEFQVIKQLNHLNEHSYSLTKADRLLIRYKITDASGNVIVNTLNFPDSSVFVMDGNSDSIRGGYYTLSFTGQSDKCFPSGDVLINLTDSNTVMHVQVVPYSDVYVEGDCPNGFYEFPFPNGVKHETPMTLTKQ